MQVLVDRARARGAARRGGGVRPLPLELVPGELGTICDAHHEDLDALHTHLSELEALNPRAADTLRLRYAADLTVRETAQALGLSPAVVQDDWTWAKAWLLVRLQDRD